MSRAPNPGNQSSKEKADPRLASGQLKVKTHVWLNRKGRVDARFDGLPINGR